EGRTTSGHEKVRRTSHSGARLFLFSLGPGPKLRRARSYLYMPRGNGNEKYPERQRGCIGPNNAEVGQSQEADVGEEDRRESDEFTAIDWSEVTRRPRRFCTKRYQARAPGKQRSCSLS